MARGRIRLTAEDLRELLSLPEEMEITGIHAPDPERGEVVLWVESPALPEVPQRRPSGSPWTRRAWPVRAWWRRVRASEADPWRLETGVTPAEADPLGFPL
jgi:hypothetical protein